MTDPIVPRICVIIPTYNSSEFLREALDSALREATPQFELEILAIDDGSTDDTPEIVKSYGGRVRFLPISHTGCVGAVRNRGIRATDAEYVAFLDHDDVCLPGRFERQLSLIQSTNADLAVSDCLEFTTGSSIRTSFMEKIGAKKELQRRLRDHILTNALEFMLRIKGLTPPSAAMARRQSLLDLGLFREDLYGSDDFEMYLRIAARGHIAVDFIPVALRRLHANNASRSQWRMVSDGIVICEGLQNSEPVANSPRNLRLVKRMEARWLREDGALHLEAGDRNAARRAWARSVRLRPSLRVAIYWSFTILPLGWLRALQRIKTIFRGRRD